jgi:xanthine dehydrogenase accessory factor
MRDLLTEYESLAAGGGPVGRAVVTSVWGSAPRPEGACLLATRGGKLAGSVSGGCVESVTAGEIADAIERGTPKLVTFGVSDETAWEVGLACGGTIKIFVEPLVRPEILAAARSAGGVVVATVVEGGPVGASLVIRDLATSEGALPSWMQAPVEAAAASALAAEASRSIELRDPSGSPATVFLEVFPRQPKLVVFGGVHIAAELVRLAQPLGYRTIVADGRQAFLTRERFPTADELILAWPEEAFRRVGLDRACYVCILSHDPKFDEPALRLALKSEARYVGAIGARKTQEARRERLRAQGLTEAEIARLRGPIGLDLGGRSPAEVALAILAEMTATRYGKTGGPKSTGN